MKVYHKLYSLYLTFVRLIYFGSLHISVDIEFVYPFDGS